MSGTVVDDVMIALGWWGRYTKFQFAGLLLPLFVQAFHIMSIVHIGRAVDHQCAPLSTDLMYSNANSTHYDFYSFKTNISSTINNDSQMTPSSNASGVQVFYDKCNVEFKDSTGKTTWKEDCPNGYQYNEPRKRTIVSEWDLVCSKETLSDFTQTIYALGMTLGSFLFPSLADKFGRKPIYMISNSLLTMTVIVTALVPNYVSFLAMRFLTGALQQGMAVVTWVLLMEILPAKHRALAGQFGVILWPTGGLMLGLVAYLTRELSWRYTQLASLIFSSYVLIQWWLTDESLRWLVANNKVQEAEKLVRKAAKWNKASLDKVMDVFYRMIDTDNGVSVPLQSLTESETKDSGDKAGDTASLLQLLKNPRVVTITLLSAYVWFALNATYYGLIMTSSTLVEEHYLGYTVNVLVEIPAGIVFLLVINRMNRRSGMIIFHVIAGLCLLATVCLTTVPGAESLPGARPATVIISLLGKFATTTGFGIAWIYTPEYFPTNIRNTCYGLACLAGRVGSMVTPYSRSLGRHLPWLPGLIFSILCLLICVVALFLPETHGRELPQSVADLERMMWSPPKRRRAHISEAD